jgi:Right handed beta helix region
MKVLFLTLSFGIAVEAGAASVICGVDVVNRQEVDAAISLASCIASAANGASKANPATVELPAGNYYMNSSLNLGSLSFLTIKTQGNTSGPACLQKGAQSCAQLIAKPTHPGPDLLSSFGATGLTLDHIAIDGNHGSRRAKYPSLWGSSSAPGYNAHVHQCTGCTFLGFTSTRAVRGTGMEFSGDNAIFDNVYFFENGWGTTNIQNPPYSPSGLPRFSDAPYSDGLTVLSSANIVIQNSVFFDNSDVDIIVGGAPNARILNNLIGNRFNFAFAALMLDNFNGTTSGDFTSALVQGNKIQCGGYCGIGMDIGPHYWYASPSIRGTDASITGNAISGARQGILVVGANGFNIKGNKVISAGAYTNNKNCWAVPFSVSPGDQVAISGNNVEPQAVSLWPCQQKDLANLALFVPGADFQIERLYHTILGREPDINGARAWTQVLASWGLPLVREHFASSAESQAKLDSAYEEVLGRKSDAGGRAKFTHLLGSGTISVDQVRSILELSREALTDPYRRY